MFQGTYLGKQCISDVTGHLVCSHLVHQGGQIWSGLFRSGTLRDVRLSCSTVAVAYAVH